MYGWDNLNTKVTNNTNSIETEISNRQNADTNLQTQITTNATNIASKVPKSDYSVVSDININEFSEGEVIVYTKYNKSYYLEDGSYYTNAGSSTPLFSVDNEYLKLSKNSNIQYTFPLLGINTDKVALKRDVVKITMRWY